MRQQFYGKRYKEYYEVEPIQSLREVDDRINNPENYIGVDHKFVEDVLIREVDYTRERVQSRTVIENVLCQIERTEVGEDEVKYFTNYTFEVIQPTEDEYKDAINEVVNEANKRKNNKLYNIVEFARQEDKVMAE